MVYSNSFVAAIKVSGKTLREKQGTVQLPFGAEYSIYLKNLSTVRALVSVSIDGASATDGTSLIVPANDSVNLERYIRNGNFQSGNRFKFIERTAAVEKHRGVQAEDGLLRIEYRFEVPVPQYTYHEPIYTYTLGNMQSPQTYYNSPSLPSAWSYSNGILRGARTKGSSGIRGSAVHTTAVNTMSMTECSMERSVDPEGITVAGSVSEQRFICGTWFPTENISHAIILKLAGRAAGSPVRVAVQTRAKISCTTCGTANKSSHGFCKQCGTALLVL